jgi:ribosomal protein S18 acetylase RimI-like enzyme
MSSERNRAGHAALRRHFQGCALDSALAARVDDGYIEKLLARAERFERWEGDELVGLVAIYCNDTAAGAAFVTMVSVVRPATGQGIARALLSEAIAHAASLGFDRVELEVAPSADGAIALYSSEAFAELSRTAESVRMSRPLG